jgi:hypothetical protein
MLTEKNGGMLRRRILDPVFEPGYGIECAAARERTDLAMLSGNDG